MIHYKNTQKGTLITILFGLTLVFFLILFLYNKETLVPLIILFIVFSLALLCFYKMTITIDDKEIKAVLGIGLIKRSLKLEDIDLNTIEEIKVPWYVGIGIRLTSKGTLYNVKTGNAIYIKSKDKLFYVGTDDYNTIKNVLVKLKTN